MCCSTQGDGEGMVRGVGEGMVIDDDEAPEVMMDDVC